MIDSKRQTGETALRLARSECLHYFSRFNGLKNDFGAIAFDILINSSGIECN